jgi:TRAP-type C4-dicarboxylate transport system substrate-binding protein
MRALVIVLGLAAVARAEPPGIVLRIGTIAPDGTAWAREMKAYARDVEAGTKGRVKMKIYFGGISGDELQVGERIRAGQLDGTLSGGAFCQKLAPSMRLTAIQGLFQNRDEASHVMGALNALFEDELRSLSFVLLGTAGVGPVILFTNKPVHTLDEVRRLKLSRWSLDDVGLAMDRALGIHSVPLAPDAVSPALEAHEVDGIFTSPTAVLAWQMHAHLRYYLDLRTSYYYGCTALAGRAFDRLSVEDQQILRAATAKFRVRLEEVGGQQDEALLGGLFQKQGLQPLKVSNEMRSEFLAAARQARQQLADQLVPAVSLRRALAVLADFRAEH